MSFAPLVAMSAGILISFRYKLNRDKQKMIADLLKDEEIDESKRGEIIDELQR